MEVVILATPVIGNHQYVKGTIKSIGKKMVVVQAFMPQRWTRGMDLVEVKRYADQVFVF